ncbi:MAG: glycosyltransferase family 1 protein [Ktedonobacteraceae bacterium]|nr:glycosyltransferase family 1 protein [Ktedonobacteraceae bacterium]
MARMVITTFGSMGDLNPFIALGTALRSRGHDVLFSVEGNLEPQISLQGFPVRLLTGDQEKALAPFRQQIFHRDQPLLSLRLLVEQYILPTLPAKVAELREICQQADLLISVAPQFAASIVAELLHLPWVSVVLTPSTLPSARVAAQPLSTPLPAPLQRWRNRFSWFLAGIFLRQIVDQPINRVRREFQVPPRTNLMWTGNLSPHLTALAVSPAFLPRPDDWPESLLMTGFYFWDRPQSWQCPEMLKDFLQTDQPIVAVTAGSVVPEERAVFAAYYQTSIESILACGARALVINAPQTAILPEGREDILYLSFVPFSEVFPACAAVIHHGGIGTIAQCLRAGVPSLVVPGGMDQPFNAAQMVQRQAGLWIPRKQYTTRRAERALNRLLSTPAYQERMREIRAQILQEDGVTTFCAAVEQLLRHIPV